jgi:WD40 repeat protein
MINQMTKFSLLLLAVQFLVFHGIQTLHAQSDESHVLTFKEHKGPVYSIAVKPDGSMVASSAEDRLIHLWDISSGEIRKTYEGHRNPVKYMEFSSDGRYLISAAATEIRIWDLTKDTWKDYRKHVTHVYNVTFNKDASQFLSTSLKTKFNLWDREENEVIHEFEGHTRSALVAAWSPDEQWIASGSGDQSIRIWDASKRETIHSISAHGGNIYSLHFSPDSRLLASASMDENIKIWDVATGKIHKLLQGHEYAVVFVRFSPDGKYLISASYDKTVKLWELATGNCVYTFVDQNDAIYAADFTPDGKHVISCSNDGTVMIYEMSPRFFAEYYYFNELENDLEESGLQGKRRKGENKDDFNLRIDSLSLIKHELYLKYHLKHVEDLGKQ